MTTEASVSAVTSDSLTTVDDVDNEGLPFGADGSSTPSTLNPSCEEGH